LLKGSTPLRGNIPKAIHRTRFAWAIAAALLFPGSLSATEVCVFERSACPKACPAIESVQAFSRWVGRPINRITDFSGGANWDDLAEHSFNKAQYWHQHAPGMHLTLAVPMLPSDGGRSSLAEGASGAYDAHFRALAAKLAEAGEGDAELRLGWEFNGNWFGWRASADPQAFVTFWRRIVEAMRSIPGTHFTFNWNPSLGGHAIALDRVYPGDNFVDAIGIDLYNYQSGTISPQNRWLEYLNKEFGLGWLARFASEHGKALTVPEWGTGRKPGTQEGGGDDAYFVEQVGHWFEQHNVVYACYFNVNQAGAIYTKISDGQLPAAADALRRSLARHR
jgi:hypothetical protein